MYLIAAPFIAAMVGGGGLSTANKNISIVPWAVGENTTAVLTDANTGNELVTYVSGSGLARDHLRATGEALAGEAIAQGAAAGDGACARS